MVTNSPRYICQMSENWESFTPDDDWQDMYQQYYPENEQIQAPLKPKVVKAAEIKPSGNANKIKIVKPNKPVEPTEPVESKTVEPTTKESKSADKVEAKPKKVVKSEFKEITETFKDMDLKVANEFFNLKDALNIVFIGHVDAGKSTLGGQILIQSGMVDQRTLEKYQREAAEQNRESWYLAWALDLNQDERSKGITVEAGKAFFETENKKVIILDAPGHKNYIPNMIGAAQQADLGILVISARKGEFEAGFEKNGQSREHAILAKTAGLKYLVVVINKMDESTVNWSIHRYTEIVDKIAPFLKQCGYSKEDVHFMPISGYTGANVKNRLDKGVFDHYNGPSLLEYLNEFKLSNAQINKPFIMMITDKVKDMGVYVSGKIATGVVQNKDQLVIMPSNKQIQVIAIEDDSGEVDRAKSGDNIRLKIKGVEEDEIFVGNVICAVDRPIKAISVFECQLVILDTKHIIAAGYSAVMHLGHATSEITIDGLLHMVDKKTKRKSKKAPTFVKKGDCCIVRIKVMDHAICAEKFKDVPQLGRFTVRTENTTVAMGKITKLLAFQE
eukprot:NODE_443_length_7346_cov_1.066648.p1 type:complete len:559 gc:universal NODE_443_length_7346_cov_1.066648:6666-4990(-)